MTSHAGGAGGRIRKIKKRWWKYGAGVGPLERGWGAGTFPI